MKLYPRIPSEGDSRFARDYFKGLVRKDFETNYVNLYYLLEQIERSSEYVRKRPLPAIIPVLDIMAEFGPYKNEVDNERFKKDQRKFVQTSAFRKLIMKCSHNIPQDNPDFVIKKIVNFYTIQLYK